MVGNPSLTPAGKIRKAPQPQFHADLLETRHQGWKDMSLAFPLCHMGTNLLAPHCSWISYPQITCEAGKPSDRGVSRRYSDSVDRNGAQESGF